MQHAQASSGAPKEPPSMQWDGSSWGWINEERRRTDPAPTIPEITTAAIRRTSAAKVSEKFGLSRQACLAIAAGVATNPSTFIVAGLRLGRLAELAQEL
jgi:hypothetical protein